MLILGDILVGAMLLYAFIGVLFAARFITVVAAGFNERSQYSGPFFRITLVPGAILLWPLLLYVEFRGRPSSGPPSLAPSASANETAHPDPEVTG